MPSSSLEKFISKAKVIHGLKYNYEKVNYISAKSNVTITCPVHGDFKQAPTNHLSGKGCRKCFLDRRADELKISQTEFLSVINKIHGKRYDLSEVKYVNAHTNIKVKCYDHGYFYPSPQAFKKGGNCPKCVIDSRTGKSKVSHSEIISQFKKVHKEKYDYSKVVYSTKTTKVSIGCVNHGFFNQSPKQHINGAGCPKCAGNKSFTTNTFLNELKVRNLWNDNYDYSELKYKNAKSKVRIKDKSTDTYHLCDPWSILNRGSGLDISNAENKTKYAKIVFNKVHGNTYDYSLLKYTTTKNKIKIICRIHGLFKQPYSNHLNGQGCPKCGDDQIGKKLRKKLTEVIDDFRIIHGNRYDYSDVEYKSSKQKVKIVCKKHGVFNQTPGSHLNGSGCPKCKQSTGENTISVYLKKEGIQFETQKKFEGMRSNLPLKCDFYIKNFNLVIEYNGRQHYEPIKLWGGTKQLKKTQELDKIKKEFCLENGINFEVIKFDEDINTRLVKILKNYS